MQPLAGAAAHEGVIGGVKLDRVAPVAAGIERLQHRPPDIGRAALVKNLRRPEQLAELAQIRRGALAALAPHRLFQGTVAVEKIDIGEGRRLVEDLVCFEYLAHGHAPLLHGPY